MALISSKPSCVFFRFGLCSPIEPSPKIKAQEIDFKADAPLLSFRFLNSLNTLPGRDWRRRIIGRLLGVIIGLWRPLGIGFHCFDPLLDRWAPKIGWLLDFCLCFSLACFWVAPIYFLDGAVEPLFRYSCGIGVAFLPSSLGLLPWYLDADSSHCKYLVDVNMKIFGGQEAVMGEVILIEFFVDVIFENLVGMRAHLCYFRNNYKKLRAYTIF